MIDDIMKEAKDITDISGSKITKEIAKRARDLTHIIDNLSKKAEELNILAERLNHFNRSDIYEKTGEYQSHFDDVRKDFLEMPLNDKTYHILKDKLEIYGNKFRE